VRIAFWGTPEFANTVLRALIDAGHDLAGIVTQPDRPAGRGRKPRPPPVKRTAEDCGIPVLQPVKPVGEEFTASFRALGADASVVAAYGHILRAAILDLPRLGSFNVHASLLPELRGAAPVNWAIIRGHEETGITIMRMVEKLDAGPMIVQARYPLPADITAGALAERLAELGAEALLEALDLIGSGRAEELEQNHDAATYAPKLSPDDVKIDWKKPAVEIARWIRGVDPVPGAWSKLGDLRVQMFGPQPLPESSDGEPGTVLTADPRSGMQIATGSAVLAIAEVQPAGKRRMSAVEWIRGRGVSKGATFS